MEPIAENLAPLPSKRSRWIFVAVALQIITLAALVFIYLSSQKPIIPETKEPLVERQEDTKIAALQHTMDELNARIASLEREPEHVPDTQKMESLEHAIDALEEKLAAQSGEQSVLVGQLLALDQLESAAMQGRPYATALEALIASGAVLDERDMLERHQHKGIATRRDLKLEFDEAVRAYFKPQTDQNQTIWQRVSSLVTIRKIGETHKGDDTQSIIARAENAMNDNNIDLALEELETLTETDRAAFASWIKRAKARQNLLRALNDVQSRLKASHD